MGLVSNQHKVKNTRKIDNKPVWDIEQKSWGRYDISKLDSNGYLNVIGHYFHNRLDICPSSRNNDPSLVFRNDCFSYYHLYKTYNKNEKSIWQYVLDSKEVGNLLLLTYRFYLEYF